jgi:SusD family.
MADSKRCNEITGCRNKEINGEYQRVTLDTRNYNERMNLAPIPQDEVNNCPNIYQNPGY